MQNYEEVKFRAGISLAEAVGILQHYNYNDKKVYGIFNGHTFYSDNITLDKAYKEVMGCTKEEYDHKIKIEAERIKKEIEEEKQRAIENIPNWIEKGHELFSEDKWELWDSIVPIRAKDLYNGMELDNLLELQAILSLNEKEADTFYNAKQILERQGHSGLSYSLTVSMVKEFCTNGEKFVEYLKG